ncbi:PH domain-containing protein [Nocardioides caeni]
MLLVHPIIEVGKFLPVLIGLLVAGGASGTGPWALLGVGVPVALGVVRYLTTTWRIHDDRVELRRGLLQRHNLSTPVDRVRTVDLTAPPVHRVLGLAKVVIGTGSVTSEADERLELDALPREQAAGLRTRLLHSRGAGAEHPDAGYAAPVIAPEVVVTRFSVRWLWYSPFSGTVLVAVGAVLAAVGQLAELVEIRISEEDFALVDARLVAAVAVAGLVVALLLGVVGYLVTNGGFLLSRQGAAWHVRRGLVTRRETSIDVARLAGVSIAEPAVLRWVRGRRVRAIVTGLGSDQSSSAVLLPPAPASTARQVAAAVLDTPEPATGTLTPHGPAARTRRFTRALLGGLPFAAAPVVVVLLTEATPRLLVLSALVVVLCLLLAIDRSRALGHAHLAGHVVMRSGSLARSRDALADRHVIGWNHRATWFQRRAGLVSVSATTAGGRGSIQVDDMPVPAACALAVAATPGLIDQFLLDPAEEGP